MPTCQHKRTKSIIEASSTSETGVHEIASSKAALTKGKDEGAAVVTVGSDMSSQQGSAEETEKLYEERMEDEYAKRKGGAWCRMKTNSTLPHMFARCTCTLVDFLL
ncbi:MAG: hypothetical protein FE78DRAFT_312246 [Acidomyces sp. 'richmondensis']|nr:MAG: hypothetical protein FE78DRAFT_312246 [Acidomyces sp. 'richmondensis']